MSLISLFTLEVDVPLLYLGIRSIFASRLPRVCSSLPAECKVIRDGKEFPISCLDLVVGDIVHLTIGSKVPAGKCKVTRLVGYVTEDEVLNKLMHPYGFADIRIIQSNSCKVEMSSLTGESDAIACKINRVSDVPAEAKNLIFNSSLVMNGMSPTSLVSILD